MTTLYVDNIAPNLQSKISAPNLQLPSGSVVQVVQTSSSADESTTSTSFVDSNLSVNITPSSTSSKILVSYYTSVRKAPGDTNNAVFIQLLRDSTVITAQDYIAWNQQSQYGQGGVSVCHLDSPSTTSATSYKIYINSRSGYTAAYNRTANDTDAGYTIRPRSTITVMEIEG